MEITFVQRLPDFEAKEFKCMCGCGLNNMTPVFLWRLQQCRTEAGVPFVITSGSRCKEYNKKVGGHPNSSHLTGEAADILIKNGCARYKILNAAFAVGFLHIGVGKNFIHLGHPFYGNQNNERKVWMY